MLCTCNFLSQCLVYAAGTACCWANGRSVKTCSPEGEAATSTCPIVGRKDACMMLSKFARDDDLAKSHYRESGTFEDREPNGLVLRAKFAANTESRRRNQHPSMCCS